MQCTVRVVKRRLSDGHWRGVAAREEVNDKVKKKDEEDRKI